MTLPECESDGIPVPRTSLQRLPAAFGVKVKFPSGVSPVLQDLAPACFSSPSPRFLTLPVVLWPLSSSSAGQVPAHLNVLSQALPLCRLPFLFSSHFSCFCSSSRSQPKGHIFREASSNDSILAPLPFLIAHQFLSLSSMLPL